MTRSWPTVAVVVEQLRRRAPGGIGTYASGLVGGLTRLAGRPDGGPAVRLVASRWAGSGADPLVALGWPVEASLLPGPLLSRAWDRGALRGPRGVDVVHATSLLTPPAGGPPLVVTVHDLLWRDHPEAYPARGRAWHEAALRRALRRATAFVVPSRPVADRLADAGADPATVTVIGHGSDHLPAPDPASERRLRERLGIEGPFVLSVGTLEPRKNLDRVVAAYRSVRHRLPGPWPLVVAGPGGWGEEIPGGDGVVLAGRLDDGELAAAYRCCRLLCYVPLAEGFGLPPLEAMAAGAPVVASPLPSTGGASFVVDPLDVVAIAGGLLEVASDDAVRARLIEAGRAHAARHRWVDTAAAHAELYAEVASR